MQGGSRIERLVPIALAASLSLTASNYARGDPYVPPLDEESSDTPSDERVGEILEEARAGRHDARCSDRPSEFPGVVVVGRYLESAARCSRFGVVVDGAYHRWEEGTGPVLVKAGWADAAPAERAALFDRHMRELVLGAAEVLDEPTEHFDRPDTPSFRAPQLSRKGEALRWSAWTRTPPSKDAERALYQHVVLVVNGDGEVQSGRVSQDLVQFSVPEAP